MYLVGKTQVVYVATLEAVSRTINLKMQEGGLPFKVKIEEDKTLGGYKISFTELSAKAVQ